MVPGIRHTLLATVLAAFLPPGGRLAYAAAPKSSGEAADTVRLGEVSVGGAAARPLRVSADGTVSFDSRAVRGVPRLLGEADPLRFMASLPGVSVSSDYASGLSVDGMGYGGTMFRLNGIPIHFPYHFGGIFSVVAPTLFDNARLERASKGSADADAAGGAAYLESSKEHPRRVSAELNAGMLASTGYVSVPAGERWSLAASGRVSYIDALYGSMLRDDAMAASYGLADCAFVAAYTPSASDRLEVTLHYNRDHLRYIDRSYALTTGMRWHNAAAGARWTRRGERVEMSHSVYWTRFRDELSLDMASVSLTAPTGIDEIGAAGSLGFTALPAPWTLRTGYAARGFRILSQSARLSGIGQGTAAVRAPEWSGYGSVWADAGRYLAASFTVEAGARADVYAARGYMTVTVDPRLGIRWRRGRVAVSASVSRSRQYLHTVGFSDLGLASNFKIASSRAVLPMDCYTAAIGANARLPLGIVAGVEGSYRMVRDQPEYLGAVLDILAPGYVAESYIRSTSGYNAGGSASMRGVWGRVEGTASYTYTFTRRHMDGVPGWFSSAGELRHVARASALWRPGGGHWTLSASFAYASGRPYTPVTAIYLIGEQLMMEYGSRNSARLPAYHRLDLGATYAFRSGGRMPLRHEFNFSLVNAYGRRNVEARSFALDYETGAYFMRDVASQYRFLPSVSYTVIL